MYRFVYNSVSVVTRLQLDNWTIVGRLSAGSEIPPALPINFRPFLRPTQLLITWTSGTSFLKASGRDVKPTTALNSCLV